MSMTAEIRSFSGKLANAPEKARELAMLATSKSTFDTLGDARRDAPVDTGYLRASGTVNMSLGDTVTGEVYFSAEYAVYVHDGTSRMPPRPFLRNSFEAHSKEWIQAMEQIGGQILE